MEMERNGNVCIRIRQEKLVQQASKQARISELNGRTSYCMEEKWRKSRSSATWARQDKIRNGFTRRKCMGKGKQGGGGTAGEVMKLHDKRLGWTNFPY